MRVAPCCHHPADVPCKSNFYFRHPRSQANSSSRRGRTSMGKGRKVKHMQYKAVIGRLSLLFCLFLASFLMGLFSFTGYFRARRCCRCCRCWSQFGARLRSPWPRARPLACVSTVSTNAFRAELHAFSGVSQTAASADCNQIQSGIKRRS